MLLASLIRYVTPAALLMLTSCAAPLEPDIRDVHGGADITVVQGFAYYPEPLIQEFKKLNHELALAPTKSPVTATAARIRWEIDNFDERCEVAIALRRPSHWENYAWAGEGELMNATPNWWGVAQERHQELRDPPVDSNPSFRIDLFVTGQPTAAGQALVAWHLQKSPSAAEIGTARGYLAYGCADTNRFVVVPIPTVQVSASPT